MPADLIVPPTIEAVIQKFNQQKEPFSELSVQQELGKARKDLKNPTPEEKLGAWSEILAFGLVHGRTHQGPWGTFFVPIGSGTTGDGKPFYSPDITGTPPPVVPHWASRARTIKHPVLKARYADLAWDMAKAIANTGRNPEDARIAIDAYVASALPQFHPEAHDRFEAALRAFDLAIVIKDSGRTKNAKLSLLSLHKEAMATKKGLWWMAFDRLIQEKNADVTDQERNQLVSDLESLVVEFSDTTKSAVFDPHATQSAAERLVKHYMRAHRSDDVKRLHAAVGRVFEHFAGLGDALLASAVLQTAVDAYRDAGLPDESRRVRILMQEKIGQSRDEMRSIGTEIKITKDDIDKFLSAVVSDDLGNTFVRVASEFLPRRSQLEKQVQKYLENAPLMAHLTASIIGDDHVAAKVGSVEEDPFGHLLRQPSMSFGLSALWLQQALTRTMEVHHPVPEHFVGWANRSGIFEDVSLLLAGVQAWFQADFVKAAHVLIPQIELGLRSIVDQLGRPVTKAHPKVSGVSVVIGMGDILYSDEIAKMLGRDLSLYFLALYADPRGYNLRNQLAHGLLDQRQMHEGLVNLMIHTLLVFGVWKELAKRQSAG